MASRRKVARSDASSIARRAQVALLFLDAADLESAADSVALKRSLSLTSVISTRSSFARRFQSARFRPHLQLVNQIGSGLQGAVFEIVGKTYVLKKESPGNELRPSNLQSEYKMHCDVSAAFELHQTSTQSIVHVPKPHDFILKTQDEAFWTKILPKIPQDYCTRGNVVTMERILPLPKVVRKAIITFFCGRSWNLNDTEVEYLLNNPQNKHCLARVYLGKVNGSIRRENPAPLRNFPLYLDWMEELGIDTVMLSQEMGKAYATLHWGAAINGDDVEFVLGTSATRNYGTLIESPDLHHRTIGLYLLDFGQCEEVDLKQDCDTVYQALKGAMVLGDNQLFVPRASTSPPLFEAFKKGYIDAGTAILSARKLNKKFNLVDFMK
ncbi:hypothetical protein N7478_002513 [Penicillium angulare]|uniref:uncharacterized protein n=1 Tax=Penicillium angulare TaxID=116970 RepID=UPI002540248A|nr:uncharacterized protein N7478_002513 [Penicillium angulare]KAJ5286827.1 hypothetical protein N7478_002513 [Penicillium angulare]